MAEVREYDKESSGLCGNRRDEEMMPDDGCSLDNVCFTSIDDTVLLSDGIPIVGKYQFHVIIFDAYKMTLA